MSRLAVLLLSLLAPCLLTSVASAQTSAESAEEDPPAGASAYEAALEQSLAAHSAGHLQEAREAMEDAHALQPSARTLRGLGVIALAEGHHEQAARYLLAALDDSRLPLTPSLRASVEKLLTRCWQEVSRVSVTSVPAEATLRVDGEKPTPEAGGDFWLEPGEHHFELSAAGHVDYAYSETLRAGELHSVHAVLAREPATVASPPLSESALPAPGVTVESADNALTPVASEDLHSQRRRRAQWGLLGTGFSLGAVAFATWMTARVRFNDIQDSCKDGCSATRVQALWSKKSIQPLKRAATGLAATGAALLLASGGLYLWHWRGEKRETSLAWLGSGLALRVQH